MFTNLRYLQTTTAVSDFVERKQYPLSHRVDVGPLKVALASADHPHTQAGVLLASLRQFQTSVTTVLSKATESDGATLGWMLRQQPHLTAQVTSVTQSVANMRTLNARLRCVRQQGDFPLWCSVSDTLVHVYAVRLCVRAARALRRRVPTWRG